MEAGARVWHDGYVGRPVVKRCACGSLRGRIALNNQCFKIRAKRQSAGGRGALVRASEDSESGRRFGLESGKDEESGHVKL